MEISASRFSCQTAETIGRAHIARGRGQPQGRGYCDGGSDGITCLQLVIQLGAHNRFDSDDPPGGPVRATKNGGEGALADALVQVVLSDALPHPALLVQCASLCGLHVGHGKPSRGTQRCSFWTKEGGWSPPGRSAPDDGGRDMSRTPACGWQADTPPPPRRASSRMPRGALDSPPPIASSWGCQQRPRLCAQQRRQRDQPTPSPGRSPLPTRHRTAPRTRNTRSVCVFQVHQ